MPSDSHDILQRQVDELAEKIGRPVDLEDRDLRVLAYSAHEGEVDAVRRRSILARASTREVDAWMRRHGIHAADGPVRLPAAPELDMAPRVCVPVRDPQGLLGFLWLVDEAEHPVPDADVTAAADAAAGAAIVLRRMRDAEDEERAERDVLLHRALRGEPDAPDALIRSGALVVTASVTVAATGAPPELGGRLRRLLPSRHALDLVAIPGELLLVLALPAGTDLGELGLRIADAAGTPVGLADPRPSLDALPAALHEARAAALVARAVPDRGPAARFGALGADGRLALLPTDGLDALRELPALARLAQRDSDGTLRATVLTWLDHGADATAAAAELTLHRATLYQRLKRVEELAGVDLHDGDARLALHMALRADHLRGA